MWVAVRLGEVELVDKVCVAANSDVADLRKAFKAEFQPNLDHVGHARLQLENCKAVEDTLVAELRVGGDRLHPLLVVAPARGACTHHGAVRARPPCSRAN